MIDTGKDQRIVNLFTRGSHHHSLSVIYIVQNLFHQGKGSRSISLNSHYLTIRPVAGYGSIAHEAKPNGLLTRGP